jgi:glycosyltransferase involved in cell wall biosynthesis
MKLLFFSVVICVFNEEKWVERCLESVLDQSYDIENYEIIIIDDGSTDGTSQIVENLLSQRRNRLPKIQYVKISHGGVGVARNMGIHIAKGDVLAWVDGDAIADRNWLYEMSRSFNLDDVGLVGGKIDLLNQGDKFANLIHHIRYFQVFNPSNYRNHFIGCNMAIRQDVFDEVPGFYESFTSRGEETSFYHMAKQKSKYAPARDSIVYHERPAHIVDWLKMEWKEKLMGVLSDRVVDRNPRERIIKYIEFFEKLMVALCPLIIIFTLVSWKVFPLLILSSAAFLRLFIIKESHRKTFFALTDEYGLGKSMIFWWLYIKIDAFVSILGRSFGILQLRSEKIIKPHTTNSVILMQKTNY